MSQDYTAIVHKWFEELKPLFVNLLKSRYSMGYDDAMDIYIQVWMDVRENILRGRTPQTDESKTWKAYILRMGLNQASNMVRDYHWVSYDTAGDDDDDRYNPVMAEAEKKAGELAETTVFDDPALHEVLGNELSCIPEPCNSILKMHYYDGLSMTEIANCMNYASSRSAITTNHRCMEKLRTRVKNMVKRLGIIE